MLEELLIALASFAAGGFGARWLLRRPRKFAPEDRDAGLARYQRHKASR